MPILVIFSACNQQNVSQNNQNLSNQNSSVPTQTASKQTGFVYTADERGNSISVIDLAANQVRKIPISVAPHNVQTSQDGQWLLVVGAPAGGGHSHDEKGAKQSDDEHGDTNGKLLIFDIEKLNDGDAVAEIEIGKHPGHVVIDPQGKFIYTTNSEDDTVSVVDRVQKKVVNTIKTGKFPHGLRISPDGKEIYIANVNDGTVSIISADQQKEVVRVPVGKSPVQVGFTPDGKRVYVALRDENSVAVVDTGSRKKSLRFRSAISRFKCSPRPTDVLFMSPIKERKPNRTIKFQ